MSPDQDRAFNDFSKEFAKSTEELREIIKEESGSNKEPFYIGEPKIEPLRRKYNKIGRNDLCICGSGKKWKHCHMQQHKDKVNELERKDNGSTSKNNIT